MSTEFNPEVPRQPEENFANQAADQPAPQSTFQANQAPDGQQQEGSAMPPNPAFQDGVPVNAKHDIVPMTPEQHSNTLAASQTAAQAGENQTPQS